MRWDEREERERDEDSGGGGGGVNLVIQSDLFDNVVYGTAAKERARAREGRKMEWASERLSGGRR